LKVQQNKVRVLEKNVGNLDKDGNRSNRAKTEVEGRSLRIVENRWRNQAFLDTTKEEIFDLNKMLMLQVSEAKLLMENERLKAKLEDKCGSDIESGVGNESDNEAMEAEMKKLKQELATLKDEMETLKEQIGAR
jgi:hypothetical protein